MAEQTFELYAGLATGTQIDNAAAKVAAMEETLSGTAGTIPSSAAVKNYVDGKSVDTVYDISEANNGTTYANLAAALNNGNNIPSSIRKGGISIKFIQSSDNKYVQYRLMSDSWSTTEADWQGIDDEPTEGSENLVKSGGVYPLVKVVNGREQNFGIGSLTNTGEPSLNNKNSIYTLNGIPCEEGDIVYWHYVTSVIASYLVFFDTNNNVIRSYMNRGTPDPDRTLTAPQNAAYFKCSFEPADMSNPVDAYVNINGELAWKPIFYYKGHEERISEIETIQNNSGLIIGKDDKIHLTKDGIYAEETLGVGIKPEAVLGACYETQPSIYKENVGYGTDYSEVPVTGACITNRYKTNITKASTFVYFITNPSSVSFSGYNKMVFFNEGEPFDYRTPTFNTKTYVIINTEEIAFTLTIDGLDDSYCYIEETGRVLFAGKNTPYYGIGYIQEEPEVIDYGVIGDTYTEEAKFIKDSLTTGFTNRFAFCHISDEHGVFNNNIAEFVDKTEAHFLAMTGDNVQDKFTDSFETVANGINAMTKPCFITTGNHDVYNATSLQAIFDKEFAPIKEHNQLSELTKTYYAVNYPVGKQGGDYADLNGNQDTGGNGFKCIFLDSYDGINYPDGSTNMNLIIQGAMSQEQINWFVSELQDAITNNLAVIIFIHLVPGRIGVRADKWCDSFEEILYASNLTFIPQIINAFKNGTSIDFTYNGNSYSFSFNSKGKFVAYFSGHTHYDMVGYLRDYPDQLNVAIVRTSGITSGGRDVTKRAKGLHITFNYVVVDKKSGTLSVYRVGNQDTICGYKRDLFVGKWR